MLTRRVAGAGHERYSQAVNAFGPMESSNHEAASPKRALHLQKRRLFGHLLGLQSYVSPAECSGSSVGGRALLLSSVAQI